MTQRQEGYRQRQPDENTAFDPRQAYVLEPQRLLQSLDNPDEHPASYEQGAKSDTLDSFHERRWVKLLDGMKGQEAASASRAIGFAADTASGYHRDVNDLESALLNSGQDWDQVEMTGNKSKDFE